MMEWLEQEKTTPRDRADAYGLLPDVDREATTLEGACGATVELAFADAIDDKPIVLTEDGLLVAAEAAIAVPQPIFDIWPADQAMALLDAKSRPALCQHVSFKDRTKLVRWGLVEEFSKSDLFVAGSDHRIDTVAYFRALAGGLAAKATGQALPSRHAQHDPDSGGASAQDSRDGGADRRRAVRAWLARSGNDTPATRPSRSPQHTERPWRPARSTARLGEIGQSSGA
jgi:hypothetical protein